MMERRLTTIVAADMVGYSRLMAADEEGTLDRLRAARAEIVDPAIQVAGGRIVKTMGDGLLVEYPSPVEALRSVIAVQSAMQAREADRPADRRILFRVGINLGDIVIDGDDILGDGVNIAARLEGLAEPGGIVISHSVWEQVKGKVACGFTPLGPQQVKNIPDPVEVYAVTLDGIAAAVRPRRRYAMALAAAAVLLLAVGLGGWLALPRQGDALAGLPPVDRSLATASIIVLPFQDYSDDKSLDHFADGLTEDLITELAGWKEFRVIARNSSMTYKDKAVDVRTVAKEMNTRYVLEGSIRRVGDQMRITAQLIDGTTGGHVWAERFEETGSDILELQDKVIGKILVSLIGRTGAINKDELAKTWAKADAELDEYDYYLRGHTLFFRYTPEDNARAIAIWKEGLAKYPNSGLLKIKIGWGYEISRVYNFTDTPESLETILQLAKQGMADPALPPAGHRFGFWLLLEVYAYLGDREAAIEIAEQIAKDYPYDADGFFYSGSSLPVVGVYDLADQFYSRALDLGFVPNDYDKVNMGWLRYAQGDCPRALPLMQAVAVFDGPGALFLAGCLAETGEIDRANAMLQTAATDFGVRSPADFPAFFQNMPGVTDRLTAQLALAGWP